MPSVKKPKKDRKTRSKNSKKRKIKNLDPIQSNSKRLVKIAKSSKPINEEISRKKSIKDVKIEPRGGVSPHSKVKSAWHEGEATPSLHNELKRTRMKAKNHGKEESLSFRTKKTSGIQLRKAENVTRRRVLEKQTSRERKNVARPKPHSLPPLQRIPRSPPLIKPRPKEEEERSRIFIGSPPPPGLLNRQLSGSLDLNTASNEVEWRPDQTLAEDEGVQEEVGAQTVYTPTSFSLDTSYPTIILKKAPKTASDDSDELSATLLSASPSARSLNSLNSLVQSTSSLNLNSTLTLPPKLLFNGSSAVQEWVPEYKREESALTRRSSTPSIRELPSPLEGKTALQSTVALPSSMHKNKQLTPLPKKA